MSNFGLGIALLVVGGIMGGAFTTLLPYSPWSWECKWFWFALLAYAILPWTMALATIPNLLSVYSNVDNIVLVECAGFGLLWGIGSVLFGLGVDALGNSLGFALILGLTATLGSVIPLVVFHSDEITTDKGICNLVSLGVTVVGLACCCYAGVLKERHIQSNSANRKLLGDTVQHNSDDNLNDRESNGDIADIGYSVENPDDVISQPPPKSQSSSFVVGLMLCLASGVLSPCLNFSVTFGDDIKQFAQAQGVSSLLAPNAVSALGVSCGCLPSLVLCMVKMYRNNPSWGQFFSLRQGETWCACVSSLLLCLIMAILWFGGFFLYNVGADQCGSLGSVVGWPVYVNTMVLTGNVSGVVSGEWKDSGSVARTWMFVGLAVLCASIAIVGASNSF